MNGRRGDGYEVRYRLDSPRTFRGALAVVAVGLTVVAWLAAIVLSPQPSDEAVADRTTRPAIDAPRSPATGPTLPPAIERRAPMADLQIPTIGPGGLGWLDTRDGLVRAATDGAEPRYLFLEATGSTLCVCLHRVAGGLPVYELVSYDPSGQPAGNVPLGDWPTTFVERTVTDVVLEPTNRFLYVAWASEMARERWTVGLDVVSRGDGMSQRTDLAVVETQGSLGSPVDVRLWLSPDARHARIRFATIDGFRPGAPADEGWWAWTVPIAGSTPGEAIPVHEPSMPPGTECFGEGWATDRDFVAACGGLLTGEVILVRSTSLDGKVAEVELNGASPGIAWLLSQASGQLFLWDPVDHHIWRVDIPSLGVVDRRLTPADIDIARHATWPRPGPGAVPWLPRGWQPGSPGSPPDEHQLVGSRDGTIVYAIGTWRARFAGDEPGSTGVWVFDASSLDPLASWAPVGEYNSLALTPAGDQVVAAGGPTAIELAAGGGHGATVVFHDARGAGIALILRGVTPWASLLASEPPPEPT